ncbi:hypothetical protein EBT31_20880 [bacterium]|nr:hypothetical protein [bacterium]
MGGGAHEVFRTVGRDLAMCGRERVCSGSGATAVVARQHALKTGLFALLTLHAGRIVRGMREPADTMPGPGHVGGREAVMCI